jgi:hypothetical protein
MQADRVQHVRHSFAKLASQKAFLGLDVSVQIYRI